DEAERHGLVPARNLPEPERGEHAEDHDGDRLLHDLELRRREVSVAPAVGGTCKQYSKNARPQETRIACQSASPLNRKWPYHANVMKMFATTRRRTVRTLRATLARLGGVHQDRHVPVRVLVVEHELVALGNVVEAVNLRQAR